MAIPGLIWKKLSNMTNYVQINLTIMSNYDQICPIFLHLLILLFLPFI